MTFEMYISSQTYLEKIYDIIDIIFLNLESTPQILAQRSYLIT